MISKTLTGATYVLKGLLLLTRPTIRRFVLIPMLINSLLFLLLMGVGITQFDTFLDSVMPALPAWLQWVQWLIWPLFVVALLVIGFYGGLLLANLIAAPFNGLLAEAVELHLTGENATSQGGWSIAIREVIPALVNETRKIVYFLLRALPLLLLFLVPVINLAAPALWILFSAWMLSLEYADYPLARHGLSFPQMRREMAHNRAMAMGFGGAALLLSLLPVINFIAMPAAVAGATAMMLSEREKYRTSTH